MMSNHRDVLTTGEVAKICSVAPRTVSKWFDSGQLKGYRIPGSKDRRIPHDELVRFMKKHNMPLGALTNGSSFSVLIVDSDDQARENLHQALAQRTEYRVRSVASGFAAGVECIAEKPGLMFLDAHLPDTDCRDVLRQVREHSDLSSMRVIAMSSRLTDGQGNQLMAQGFDGYLRKPFTAEQVISILESAVAA